MPDELFTTRIRMSLQQAYGVAARALTVLHRRGLADEAVRFTCWDQVNSPLALAPTCTSDQLLRALEARHRDPDTVADQQRSGYPLMRLCAATSRWNLILEWPGDTTFDVDPATWDRAVVSLRITVPEEGGWLRYLQDLRLTRSIGQRKGWVVPQVVRLLHRDAARRRMADLAAGTAVGPPPAAGAPCVAHLFTTRPGEPFALLDAFCDLGLIGRDGWIVRDTRIVVCGDLIHSRYSFADDDRLPLLRWLAAHDPRQVQLVPGEDDWADLDAPDEASGELRRLAAAGRVRGALAVGLLASGEVSFSERMSGVSTAGELTSGALLLVPRLLTTEVPAPWSRGGIASGQVLLAEALDHLIRVERFIAATPGQVPSMEQVDPTASCPGVRQLVVTGGGAVEGDPDLSYRVQVQGASIQLPHGHQGLPLLVDQVPDLPVSQLTVRVRSQHLGVEIDIVGTVPAEPHHVWVQALMVSLDGDAHDFLWNCSCGVPDCAGIDQPVRIQHLGDSTLWSWLRPVRRCASPRTWVTVRFAAADYRKQVLSALRTLRDQALDLATDASVAERNHDAEWMAKWTLPEA